jgi:putative flippase GtrA
MSAALAELVRYTLAGGLVFVLYLGLTLGLSGAGLPIQVAIPVSYAIAVATHFALQRSFVFTGRGYALRTREQVARYVALGAVQYPTTALALSSSSTSPRHSPSRRRRSSSSGTACSTGSTGRTTGRASGRRVPQHTRWRMPSPQPSL